jgi:hypothetical protein
MDEHLAKKLLMWDPLFYTSVIFPYLTDLVDVS